MGAVEIDDAVQAASAPPPALSEDSEGRAEKKSDPDRNCTVAGETIVGLATMVARLPARYTREQGILQRPRIEPLPYRLVVNPTSPPPTSKNRSEGGTDRRPEVRLSRKGRRMIKVVQD